MDRPKENFSLGCGTELLPDITLNVHTTTGGNFSITVNGKYTVDNLKKIVSKRLKVSKDRICLLHREQQLRNGTMEENGLVNGSRVILLPSVETGLLTQRPENSVMQALESLNDTQVNDFLSGKSPLNLTMRLGDHMMLIQLQLSTLNCGNSQTKPTLVPPGPAAPNPALRRAYRMQEKSANHSDKLIKKTIQMMQSGEAKSTAENSSESTSEERKGSAMETDDNNGSKQKSEEHIKSFLNKKDIQTLQNAFEIFKSLAELQDDPESGSEQGSSNSQNDDSLQSSSASGSSEEPTPIKSLSNFVSSPMKSTVYSVIANPSVSEETTHVVKTVPLPKFAPLQRNEFRAGDPTTSKAASCLCSTINPNFMCDCHSQSGHAITKIENFESYSASGSNYGTRKLNPFRLAESAPFSEVHTEKAINLSSGRSGAGAGVETITPGIQEPIKNRKLHYLLQQPSTFYANEPISTTSTKQKMTVRMVNSLKRPAEEDMGSNLKTKSPKNNINDQSVLDLSSNDQAIPPTHAPIDPNPVSDTKALIEASKNLTQTLKKLSKEVLTSKVNLAHEDSAKSKLGQGAVIESMKHHGKGIYSGTFSGTLNPALQDRYGRPKRDISTIIHILNDLLCSAPAKVGEQSETPPTEIHVPERIAKTAVEHLAHTAAAARGGCTPSYCLNTRYPYDASTASATHRCLTNMAASRARLSERSEKIGQPCKLLGRTDNLSDSEADCANCHTASALALENSKTKCKLEQLRLIMQQEKRRREARKKAPFMPDLQGSILQGPILSGTILPGPTAITSPCPGPSRGPQDNSAIIVEEIDTVA